MTLSPGAPDSLVPTPAGPAGARDLGALQLEIRGHFEHEPRLRAVHLSLESIGRAMDAEYIAMHAMADTQPVSEEWLADGVQIRDALRERMTTTMLESMAGGPARCRRFARGQEQVAVLSVPLHDCAGDPCGAIGMLTRHGGRTEALQQLSRLEGLAGVFGLLLTDRVRTGRKPRAPEQTLSRLPDSRLLGREPQLLAHAIVADIANRHGFPRVAIGFVEGKRVRIAALSGVEELRPGSPGVLVIREALEECLDEQRILVHPDRDEEASAAWMNAAWSKAAGGAGVASIPILLESEIVGVLGVETAEGTAVDRAAAEALAAEMVPVAPLIPLARAASRGLRALLADTLRTGWRRVLGHGKRRLAIGLAAVCTFGLAMFAELPYRFTVPCVVQPVDLRVVSSPREGRLADIFVRPGQQVRAGQLLAVLDVHEERLRRAEIEAEIRSLESLADAALARREAGEQRVHRARIASLEAQLAVVQHNIELGEIHATRSGVILEGDLRERIGSQVSVGEELFRIARYDRMKVVLKIPERHLLAAREARAATFAPTARPGLRHELGELTVSPAGRPVDGGNIFEAEAEVDVSLAGLAPGMEGYVRIDGGPRPVWWQLGTRVIDWVRLTFWL